MQLKASTAPLAIIVSNLLFCLASFLLKKLSIVYAVPVVILMGSNLVASYSFFLRPKKYLSVTKPFLTLIFLWAFAYCVTYLVFAHFNKYLYVPHLMIAQAIAPFVVLFFKKQWREAAFKKENILESIVPLLFLGFLVYSLNGTTGFSGIKYALTGLLTVAYIISDFCYRRVSSVGSAADFQVMHTLFCSAILAPFLFTQHINREPNLLYLAGGILLLGIMIVLVQRGILFGIKYTPPLFSVLLISTSIPFSFLTEFILDKQSSVSLLQLALSLMYCLVIFAVYCLKKEEAPELLKN